MTNKRKRKVRGERKKMNWKLWWSLYNYKCNKIHWVKKINKKKDVLEEDDYL